MSQTRPPLEGIRVLDIATGIAGPGGCARLGDFGAAVTVGIGILIDPIVRISDVEVGAFMSGTRPIRFMTHI